MPCFVKAPNILHLKGKTRTRLFNRGCWTAYLSIRLQTDFIILFFIGEACLFSNTGPSILNSSDTPLSYLHTTVLWYQRRKCSFKLDHMILNWEWVEYGDPTQHYSKWMISAWQMTINDLYSSWAVLMVDGFCPGGSHDFPPRSLVPSVNTLSITDASKSYT